MEDLREELLDYFCSLVPRGVTISYDEKKIDEIISKHLGGRVEPPVGIEGGGNFTNDFVKGYTCAVATLIRAHSADTEATDVLACCSYSLKQYREMGVDEYDLEVLKPIIKEIARRRAR